MNGILILDKPAGITSFAAVRAVRRVFGGEKAGHTGTLDPMATGVLPILLGRATKLGALLPASDKAYAATAKLGAQTDTADAEGSVLRESGVRPTETELRDALQSFVGDSMQLPPMYSALKQGGTPLYELARAGQTVPRQPRPITIYDAALTACDGEQFSFTARCSAGTYIRTLAEDTAARCGALCHLTALRRTEACGFSLAQAVTLPQLEQAAQNGETAQLLLPADAPFLHCEALQLADDNLWRLFQNGFAFAASRCCTAAPGSVLRVYRNGQFAALAQVSETGQLVKLWQAEVSSI